MQRNIIYAIFTLSGFTGLIYESIWTHYLKLFLGHAAYAQTLVLAIFMGGMALGSWICSRKSAQWKNLLLFYAIAEGLIGLCAIFFHEAFARLVHLSYTAIIPELGTPFAVNTYKWTLSALLILPQSILLGMTFPLMSAGLLRIFPENPGKSVAMLYFANSIGAAVGVLVSGFMLVRLLGLPGTMQLTGLINVILALIIWKLARHPASGVNHDRSKHDARIHSDTTCSYRTLLMVSLITGSASFMYEIGWIRMLSLILGSTTHAFELMLSAFILGLAFGGLWIQGRIDASSSPIRFLMVIQVTMGLLALTTLPLYGNTFSVMTWLLNTLSRTDSGYTLFNISSHAIAAAVMLPTTFCAGMTLPLITVMLLRTGYGERSIGVVYAANTVGSIIGILFAVHVGMPFLGLKGLIIAGASLDIALGLFLAWTARGETAERNRSYALVIVCIGALASTIFFVNLDPYKMASGVYRDGSLLSPDNSKLVYHRDGKTATVSVDIDNESTMHIRTNGKVDAGIETSPFKDACIDEPTMITIAVLPMAFNPGATRVANIGFGSGLTTHTLLGNPALTQVDTIEIEPNMIEAAKYFGTRVQRAFTDPRSVITIDDAKTFFSSHNKKYDIIISEPSNPWVSGVASLFSDEFYQHIARHLNDKGVFAQWLQLYSLDTELVVSVLKALSVNFKDLVFYMPNSADMLIIATNTGSLERIDPAVLNHPEIAKALQRVHINNIQDIAIRRIGTKKMLQNYIDSFSIRANSDYFPVLDQNAGRARFLRSNAQDIFDLYTVPLPVMEMMTGTLAPGAITDVSFSPFFQKALFAYHAEAMRDYFYSGEFRSGYWAFPQETKDAVINLSRMSRDCRFIPSGGRVATLFHVLQQMVPYLKPQELDLVWNKMGFHRCTSADTAIEADWIIFFKALGKHNAPGIILAVNRLLNNETTMELSQVKYLVASQMLAYQSMDKHQEALNVWSAYRHKLFKNEQPDFIFRLLAANRSQH